MRETQPVKQQFGVVGMKNLEKGAVTNSKVLPRCPRVFARFLQHDFPSCCQPTRFERQE
jgi:hypothetical protein